jgi:hypothetical protein
MESMKTAAQRQKSRARITAEPEGPLSPERAFVVQFREETQAAGTRFRGRVEHMISGHAARFESPKELVAFLARVLGALRSTLPEER